MQKQQGCLNFISVKQSPLFGKQIRILPRITACCSH
ncbi:hypothetical protein EVA_16306 [gut metagenome]|uniref:Uncharacterized protein n=1 Tax=gut metagenome TaxID=749906 RepID=J9G806_9ZZZZ